MHGWMGAGNLPLEMRLPDLEDRLLDRHVQDP